MTLAEVVAMLDLPTAEDVADLLRAHGVKGRPTDPCCCPVARFAEQVTGRQTNVGGNAVAVGPYSIWQEQEAWGSRDAIDLPKAAVVFGLRFDADDPAFADLVAP